MRLKNAKIGAMKVVMRTEISINEKKRTIYMWTTFYHFPDRIDECLFVVKFFL